MNEPDAPGRAAPNLLPSGLETSLEWLDDLLATASEAVVDHLTSVPQLPVTPRSVDPAAIRTWLRDGFDLEEPRAGDEVITEVVTGLRNWSVHPTHPGYFGLFNPTPTGPGIAAELLAAGINPQLAAWSHAPAAVEIERHVIGFMADRLAFPVGSSGSITTGGAEANLTAVLLALAHAFPDYARAGLRGIEGQPVFYASAESHMAWLKIAHTVGLGREALRLVPVDHRSRMDPDRLIAQIAADTDAGLRPFLVVGTAGTTGAGVLDPLSRLADVAAHARLWLHTDAAWAGAVTLSDQLRPLLAGIEHSDSVTVDAHKWLSVPMGAGMILTRHAEQLAAVFGSSTGYMPDGVDDAPDPYATSIQWSRRFAGLKVFLSLAVHGRRGYADQLERDVRLGRMLAHRLAEDGWLRVNDTPLPVVCFTDTVTERLSAEAAGRWHASVAGEVLDGGTSWISPVRVSGRSALRACITSYRTTEADVGRLVEALHHARATVARRCANHL